MAAFTAASLLLLALKVTANPLPAVLPAPQDVGPTLTVTATATLYATLLPPVLPVVTVTANYTEIVYTSTLTGTVVLNCTNTVYSPIIAPASVASTSVAVPPATSSAVALDDIPEAIPRRQVTLTTTPTTPTASTTPTIPTSTVVPTTTTPEVPTVTVIGGTVTATTTAVQYPAYTRTVYSVVTAIQSTPLARTAYACDATLAVFYTIVTDRVTSTISRTVYPSTVTSTSLINCPMLPRVSSFRLSHPATAPATAPATVATLTSGAIVERQAPVTSSFSTTIHRTQVAYTAVTVTATDPSSRIIYGCESATTPVVAPTSTTLTTSTSPATAVV